MSALSRTKWWNTLIHIQYDHLPSITKQLPWSIEQSLSKLSSSKDVFYETTQWYNKKLTYQNQEEDNENTGKNRKLNIIWINLPYSKSLKTNIEKLNIKDERWKQTAFKNKIMQLFEKRKLPDERDLPHSKCFILF